MLLASTLLIGCGPDGSSSPNSAPVQNLRSVTNSAPVASTDIVNLPPGGQEKIQVLLNDSDPDGDKISIVSVEDPQHGTVFIDTNGTPGVAHDDSVTYQAHQNFLGSDSFRYTISDGNSGSATAAVMLTVGVNQVSPGAPVARNDNRSTAAGEAVKIAVLSNDVDSDGDALAITSVTVPANGTVSIDNSGTPNDSSDDQILYTPANGFSGTDSFTYTVSDGITFVAAAVSVEVSQAAPASGSLVEVSAGVEVSGVVMKGPMLGAHIELFPVDNKGNKASNLPVAQTVTDTLGRWSLKLPAQRDDLLVVASGGAFLNEAQRQDAANARYIKFSNTGKLESLLPAGENFNVISVFTNALLLKSRHDTTGGNFLQVFTNARAAVTAAFGFDPLVTNPTDPARPDRGASELERRHALALGGVANVINRVSVFYQRPAPDYQMVYAVIRDLSDCRMDGRDLDGAITFTFDGVPVAMPTGINLNTEILRFRNNNIDNFSGTPLVNVDTTVCASPAVSPDLTSPVLTLLGSNPLATGFATPFIDPGATALDNIDGDVSAQIVQTGSVDTSIPGTYSIVYSVIDAAGNTANVTRTVTVAAGIAPVITLQGLGNLVIEAGNTYVDSGATAMDNEDGDLSSSVVINNPVNSLLPGNYVVTYSVTDSSGLQATPVVRSIVVVDTTAPLLTLLGDSVVNVQEGGVYSDAGIIANDIVDGDLSPAVIVSNPVDTSLTGSYTISYQVIDSSGNVSVLSRTVNIIPSGVPSITLLGASVVYVEAGGDYIDLGAAAFDSEDGDISSSVTTQNLVDSYVVGTYLITYNVNDSDGNPAALVTRTVIVADTIAPIITRVGPAVVSLDSGFAYIDAGATALDIFDGDISANIVITNPVDPSIVGSYIVRYNVTDAAGNNANSVSRTVTVNPPINNIPVISLLGATTLVHEGATLFVDPGATAVDVEDGDVTALLTMTNLVNEGVTGSYTIDYDVTDSDGGAALTVIRNVNVIDTTNPVITLLGSSVLTLDVFNAFVDPGFIANDTVDGDITATVGISGVINVNVPGDYVLTYTVTDAAANPAVAVTRTIQVRDSQSPLISLVGDNPQILEVGSAYIELGATTSDLVDGSGAVSNIDSTAVTTNAVGSYFVRYNHSDSSGNVAPEITRTVSVVDTTPPVITVSGASPHSIGLNSPAYPNPDPNVTAWDNLDGDLTNAIMQTGFVDTSTAGDYTLYFDVSDANGNNAVQASRVVSVMSGAEFSDADGDGISDALEIEITGSATGSQSETFFVNPDPAITLRDGTSWATAFEDIEDIAAANVAEPGILPPGISAAQPTYIVLGDNSASPATVGDPDRWRMPVNNCRHIVVIGSMSASTVHPQSGNNEPVSMLNAPGSRILDGSCNNVRFYNVKIVNSGGSSILRGGAIRLAPPTTGGVFDTVIFDGNVADEAGGALIVMNNFAPTIVRNSTFRNNSVSGNVPAGGGAIRVGNNASIEIYNTVFSDNYTKAGNGGAVSAHLNADFQIDNSVFSSNESGGNGGALFAARNNVVGSSAVTHSVFSGNFSAAFGGAVYNFCDGFSPPLQFFNNFISGNSALYGGAFAIDDCEDNEYENNTIVMNEARSVSGGGAMFVDTNSLAAPNTRPMPAFVDNVFYGNIDPAGVSTYSINNLPAWGQLDSRQNLMDDAGSASNKDTVMTDVTSEISSSWYLLPTSQAIDLSQSNANNATKFQATPERTTNVTGALDSVKADAGFHFPGAYAGPAMFAVTSSQLQGNAGNLRQSLLVSVQTNGGSAMSFGNRVGLAIAPGSALVTPLLASRARFESDPVGSTVAMDMGNGDYKLEVTTNGVAGPDNVFIDVYVDGLFVNQVTVPVTP